MGLVGGRRSMWLGLVGGRSHGGGGMEGSCCGTHHPGGTQQQGEWGKQNKLCMLICARPWSGMHPK